MKLLLVTLLLVTLSLLTNARLFNQKDVCTPAPYSGTKEGSSCIPVITNCLAPSECNSNSFKCERQQMKAGSKCSTVGDCYAVPSADVLLTGPLRCIEGRCEWLRGAGDSCKYSLQCPIGLGCSDGVCKGASRGEQCLTDLGCNVGLFCIGGTCGSKQENGKSCISSSHCTSGYCISGTCVARQTSSGGTCVRSLGVDNCASSMFCDTDNKCKRYAASGQACTLAGTGTQMCQPGLMCYNGKCTSKVSCSAQSTCIGSGLYCICSKKQCSSVVSSLNCLVQKANAESCSMNKCRTSVNKYVFAPPDYCAMNKCGNEIFDWYLCEKSLVRSEHGFSYSYIGGASAISGNFMLTIASLIAALLVTLL